MIKSLKDKLEMRDNDSRIKIIQGELFFFSYSDIYSVAKTYFI